MASSASGQNFLNLLFGGVQKGVNTFQRRQVQEVDLATQLQGMMARQQEASQRTAVSQRQADISSRQADISAGQLTERQKANVLDTHELGERIRHNKAGEDIKLQGLEGVADMRMAYAERARMQAGVTTAKGALTDATRNTVAKDHEGLVARYKKKLEDYEKAKAYGMPDDMNPRPVPPPSWEVYGKGRMQKIRDIRDGVTGDGTSGVSDAMLQSLFALFAGDQ